MHGKARNKQDWRSPLLAIRVAKAACRLRRNSDLARFQGSKSAVGCIEFT